MELPQITIRELIEAGVHYGHKTMRWNPKMAPYLYGVHNDIHVIDLQQTLPMLKSAMEVVYNTAKNHGRILFVGTKVQAGPIIAEEAKRCGQYYVDHRWLGGMLTNFSTVAASLKRLEDLEAKIAEAKEFEIIAEEEKNEEEEKTAIEGDVIQEKETVRQAMRYTKKELLEMQRKADKLERSLGGIRTMGGRPDVLFVIDTLKESLAIQEARKLGIPVIAVVDSNSDPDPINYLIPGNDDATRSIRLYCRIIGDAALAGIKEAMIGSGVDVGAMADGEFGALVVKHKENQGNTKKASKSLADARNRKLNVAVPSEAKPAKRSDAKKDSGDAA